MPVIRREDAATTQPFSLADLEQQGRALLAAAQRRAEQIVADAEARGRVLHAEQRRAGYAEGLERGRREGLEQIQREAHEAALRTAEQAAREQVQALAESLAGALADFEARKHHLIASAESGLIELALAVARRVCKLEVARGPEAARANARALLELVRNHRDLELHVHPDECALIEQVAREFAAKLGGLEHVRLIPDAEAPCGGCVLRTRDGTIDATIERQLARVAEALCGVASEESTSSPAPAAFATPAGEEMPGGAAV